MPDYRYPNVVPSQRVPASDQEAPAPAPAPTPAPAPKRPWWDLRKQEKAADILSKPAPSRMDKKLDEWETGAK